jgi:uncharacterized protein YbjT (DUF2867 family)
MTQFSILIIGGGGKTGRRVKTLLEEQGHNVRAASRSSAVPFDWTRRETWAPAFEGVSKAYVTYQPDLAVEGAAEDIAELSQIARAKGVGRIVLLSGHNEPGAQRAEAALQKSGVAWTNVRASWFNQNFSEGYLIDGIRAGEVALPAPPVPEPFVDVDDIAEVVTAVLNDDRHSGKIYDVTGPRALTFGEAVAEIAAAAGRPIRYREISPEEFSADMRRIGVPDEVTALLIELLTVVLDGRNSPVMHGVDEVLGRPARDFSDYARRTAATGVWRTSL